VYLYKDSKEARVSRLELREKVAREEGRKGGWSHVVEASEPLEDSICTLNTWNEMRCPGGF
jgi:hypothetical protein